MAVLRQFDRFSFLNFFDLVTADNFTFWESVLFADLSQPREDDIEYVIKESDRIDLLSHKFYGTSHLWWLIALANKMFNIATDFRPGRKILIPSSTFVDRIFGGV
jgi:nucleoid-associated protein YgaU